MLLKFVFLLLFFNVFLVSTSLPDGLFTAKELELSISAGIACLLAAIRCFGCRIAPFHIHHSDIFLLAYMLVILLSYLLGGEFSAVQALINATSLGLCYLSIRVLTIGIRPIILLNAFVEILTITQCFLLIIVITQYIGWIPKYYPQKIATGMFFNPGPLAIYLGGLTTLSYTIAIYRFKQKQTSKAIFSAMLTAISIFFICVSLSRSAWVGLLFPMLVIGAFMLRPTLVSLIRSYRQYLIPAGLLACLLLSLGLWKAYWFKPMSAEGRGLIWKSTALMIRDHAWTGVGIGKFAASYPFYQAAYFEQSGDTSGKYVNLAGDTRYAFNDLLHIWAESGIAGFLIFLLIIASLVYNWILLAKTIIKRHTFGYQFVILGVGAIPVCILLAGLTAYPLQMIPISLLFWLSLVVWNSAFPKKGKLKIPFWIMRFKGVALACTGTLLFYHATEMYGAYKQFALQWYDKDLFKYEPVVGEQLMALYPLLNTNPEYLYAVGLYYKERNEEGLAIPYLERAIKFSPDPNIYYALAECYKQTYQWGHAVEVYAVINRSIPNLLLPRYQIALLKYTIGDMAGFIKQAQETLDFVPKIETRETRYMKNDLRTYLDSVKKYVILP